MTNKMIKLDRYFFIVCLSIILGITRYYLYDNNDFNLFSLVSFGKTNLVIYGKLPFLIICSVRTIYSLAIKA